MTYIVAWFGEVVNIGLETQRIVLVFWIRKKIK